MRFSDYFKLNKSQAELDFVDIPLDTDIRLFVDPYAFSIENDSWFVECNNLIVDYFQLLIEKIKTNQKRTALNLLSHLHEPSGTNLGFSSGKPKGKGFGKVHSDSLYEILKESKAIQTGKIEDISDCELLIPGIGSDRISDMTINIVKNKLIDYTQSQCELLNISIRAVPVKVWDSEIMKWRSCYKKLPIYKSTGLILTPKVIVRRRLTADHNEYYNKFALEYLEAEHLNANDSLVHTLKNGKKKVYKKDLQNKYPLANKEFLLEFSNNNPEVLIKYKEFLQDKSKNVLKNDDIENLQKEPKLADTSKLIEKLESIPVGTATANDYHNFIIGALECIFYPNLSNPVKEQEVNEGRKRIDIVFDNTAQSGFFNELSTRHNIKSPYIMVECKNYKNDVKNPEYDQLTGRFSNKRGLFGLLVCRSMENKEKMIKNCQDIVNDGRGYILVLDDNDIKCMLKHFSNNFPEGIDNHLRDLYRTIVF